MTGQVTLAQIVAALSVTYTDEGVAMWLRGPHRNGLRPIDALAEGRFAEIAEAVARIGDCDPREVTR